MTISEVLAQHQDEIMQLPHVYAVGEGEKDGSPAVIVWVDHNTPEVKAMIPSQVGGYPVLIETLGGDISAF